jgi:exosortase E/protease (VPEID-CTERM system)
MFALNAVRIAVLMLIGYVGYPDIAAYGFHSQAGWIAFNAVACGVAFISHRSSWLSNAPRRHEPGLETENPTAAYLMPLLCILIAGVIARSMSSGFEIGYPVRLLAGGIALFVYRKHLLKLEWRVSWYGVAVGIAVFLVWEAFAYFLLPSSHVPLQLSDRSLIFRVFWIVCRVLAAVITVPIAEELAYRGYLMRRIEHPDFESVAFRAVRPSVVFIAAIAFGLSHGSMWPAGIAAGIGFGFLLRRRGSIGDAVLAHGTANALVATCVLVADQWQLW